MKSHLAGRVILSVCLMMLGGGWCHAQSECINFLDVTGIDGAGKQQTISFRLRRSCVEYDETTKRQKTAAEAKTVGALCDPFEPASRQQNCAGFVLDKGWGIGKYNTDATTILKMLQTFGERTGGRIIQRKVEGTGRIVDVWTEDLSMVRKGDIVVYGDAHHVAFVVSADRGKVALEGKNNEGAYFRYADGDESQEAKAVWQGGVNSRTFWRLESGRIISRKKRAALDDCLMPVYTMKCPAPLSADCVAQVPQPDIKGIEKQLGDRRGLLPAGHVWLSKWMADVKSKDVDDGGSGRANDPKKITRTYHATVFCEKASSPGALVPYQTLECTQTITVENKKSHKSNDMPALSVRCEGDIPSPKPGYKESATDACGNEVQARHVQDVVVSGRGCKGNPKIIRRIFEATDASGNSNQIVQMIRVENTAPPYVASSPPDLRLRQAQAIPAPQPGSVKVEDACSKEYLKVVWLQDQIVKQGSGRFGDPLVKKRIYRASDPCGNTLDVPQTIRVEDEPPAASAVPDFSGKWQSEAMDWKGNLIEQDGENARMVAIERDDARSPWIVDRYHQGWLYGKIKGNVLTLSLKGGSISTWTMISPGRLQVATVDANGRPTNNERPNDKVWFYDRVGK